MWRFLDASGRQKTIAFVAPSIVSSLPSSPADGDEVILTDSISAGTYHWHLKYVAARSSNKWVFVGGSPATATITTSQTATTVTTWMDLATVGPSFTVPVAGNYRVQIHSGFTHTAAGAIGWVGVAQGATTPDQDTWGAGGAHGTGTANDNIGDGVLSGVAASTELRMRYYNGLAGTAGWMYRRLYVTPIAIGG